ncbi:MAG: hypothetical protein ABS900_12675, partial [Candidatus Limivicinus sp.]
MKTKHCLSILLTLAMLLSLSVCVGAPAYAEDTIASPMQQIKLISSQMDSLMQINTENPWYYCVADLDHNGCLEFIAASQHPDDRSTNLKIWTVSKDGASLGECRLSKADEESFPDIMTDTVDTYHDKDTDTWYYMVYDNAVISNAEVYTVKTAVNLKNGIIGYDPLAVEHTVVENGMKNVTHTDMNGINISPDQYNASGANAFASAERGNTAFEWLTADKVSDQNNLTESYEVFLGTREPTETFPVPKPVALGGTGTAAAPTPTPSPVPVPAPTPVPQPQPVQPTYLTITKNPTNENKKVGGSAIFVACANAYDSLNWTFVSPDGGEYSPSSFVAGSGASVSGEYSTTITVSNVESWMNGWGAYCSFYFQGQTARTSTAYIYISDSPSPTPPSPTPSYGSMSGTAYSGGAGYAINLQNGTQVFVDSWNCNVEGQFYDGCSAIVYYIDYPSNANVYRADIFGNQGLIQYTTNSNGDVYALHEAYNADGSTYNTVTCPACQ